MSSDETDGGPGAGDRPRAAGKTPRWLTIVASVVLVAGVALLVFSGVRYVQARSAQDAAQEMAQERETVADVAAQVIINAFSFDHRDVDDSLEQLADSSTGDFLAEQEQWAQDVRTRVVEQKAVTTATVSHSAVETLDSEAGDAAVLVVFTAHSEREGQEDITGRQAMRVDLTREDGQWKADAVNQVGVTVPVGQSSRSVQDLRVPDAERAGKDAAKDSEPETSTPAPTTTAGR